MKLIDIIKTVGAGIIRETVPGGGLLLGAINALLPPDKKLPDTATGQDIDYVIKGLPAEHRAAILDKEFDVELTQIKESYSTLRVMLEQDAKNPQSTRPKIALGAFRVVSTISLLVVAMWAWAVIDGDEKLVKAIVDGWPWVLALVGPFVGWLNYYFGVLKTEQKNRLDAANGSTTSGLVSLISSFIKR